MHRTFFEFWIRLSTLSILICYGILSVYLRVNYNMSLVHMLELSIGMPFLCMLLISDILAIVSLFTPLTKSVCSAAVLFMIGAVHLVFVQFENVYLVLDAVPSLFGVFVCLTAMLYLIRPTSSVTEDAVKAMVTFLKVFRRK